MAKKIKKPEDWEKAYAIGTTQPKGYTAGPFPSLPKAAAQLGAPGEFIFRLGVGDDAEDKPVREWDENQGEWTKLDAKPSAKYGADDEKPADPPTNDVELAFFEQRLRIDKDALDEALIENPDLMGKVASRYASALSRRDLAKDVVKQIEGDLYATLRERLTIEGKRPPSEKTIEAAVLSHAKRIKAVKEHTAAIRDSAEWEGMFESYRARNFALGELVKLYLQGYFASSSAKASADSSRYLEGEGARARREEAYKRRSSKGRE